MDEPFGAGVICPIVVPLEAGELNEYVLRAHIRALLGEVDGILVNGSSGEFPWLPTEVSARMAEVVVEEAAGRVRVYEGVGDSSTPRTVARIGSAGLADVAVVTPPTYFPVGDEEIVRHFLTIAEASAIPVMLYNIPQHTGSRISPAALARLASHPNIVGMKDSAGDPFVFTEYLAVTEGSEFSIVQGREQLMVWSYSLGAVGVTSAMANFAPGLLSRTHRDLVDGAGFSRLRQDQDEIVALGALFAHGYWVAALKAAVTVCGFDVGPPTAPMSPCTAGEVEAITAILAPHRSVLTVSETSLI